MNIKYHAAVGVTGEILFPCHGMFFIWSILPDSALLLNEIKLLLKKESFDPMRVGDVDMFAYHLFHSLFVTILLLCVGWQVAAIAHFIHVVCDWFTHTGRFSSKPLFPLFQYQIPFGKDILK